jgi:hypothetical protein
MPFPLVVVSCAACRERALELSGLSSLGVCAGVRPEELNQLFRPLLTCVVHSTSCICVDFDKNALSLKCNRLVYSL